MTKEQVLLEKIKHIVKLCDEVQESGESRYTKECAVITAYEHIKKAIEEETPDTCADCPYAIENIEEFDDGGCAWYECALTGQMIKDMDDCPIIKEEEE